MRWYCKSAFGGCLVFYPLFGYIDEMALLGVLCVWELNLDRMRCVLNTESNGGDSVV